MSTKTNFSALKLDKLKKLAKKYKISKDDIPKSGKNNKSIKSDYVIAINDYLAKNSKKSSIIVTPSITIKSTQHVGNVGDVSKLKMSEVLDELGKFKNYKNMSNYAIKKKIGKTKVASVVELRQELLNLRATSKTPVKKVPIKTPNKKVITKKTLNLYENKYRDIKKLIGDDCDNVKIRKHMKKIFNNVDTIGEFLYVWALFYENKICTPIYYDVFSGNVSGDNPDVTQKTGQKFKSITLNGVICVDSQVTKHYEQKGYIHAYVPNNIVKRLTTNLNRYNNIVAFNYDLSNGDKVGARDLYVTFQGNAGKKSGLATGKAYTQVGRIDHGTLNQFLEWSNETIKNEINPSTYSMLVIINPNYDSPQEYIIDVLLESLSK